MRGLIRCGVRDQVSQQQAHRSVAPQAVGHVLRFRGGNHVVFSAVKQEDRHGGRWRSRWRECRRVDIESDVRLELWAKPGHVTVIHISEQRRRGLRQCWRELAQGCEVPFGLWLVDLVEIRGPQKTAHGIAERRQLFRRDEMFGDREQDDRDAIIVRRPDDVRETGSSPVWRESLRLRSCAKVLQHAPQVVMTAEGEHIREVIVQRRPAGGYNSQSAAEADAHQSDSTVSTPGRIPPPATPRLVQSDRSGWA